MVCEMNLMNECVDNIVKSFIFVFGTKMLHN